MMSLTRKNIRLVGCGKLSAIFIGCLVFSVSNRFGNDLTFEQHILSAASDHYYLTYFLLPMALFACFSFISDDSEIVVIRYGSYFAYFYTKWVGSGAISLLFLLIQSAGILLSGIGLPFGNDWALQDGAVVTELFSVLQMYFNNPQMAFVACMIFQCLGIWFLIGICMWVSHFADRKCAVIILMFLYVIAAVWIKVPFLQKLPITGLNHLVILHHNLDGNYRTTITAITVASLSVSIFLTIRFMWRSRLTLQPVLHQGLTPYYIRELTSRRNILILCVVVVGMTLYKGLKYSDLNTAEELVIYLFAGHGTGSLHILSFLEMLIINGAPIYLLAAFIERTASGQSMYISIRTRGRKELLLSIVVAGIFFLFLYCFFWLIGGLASICFYGTALTGNALLALILSTSLKLFDLLLQYVVMIAFYTLTRQITIGFLVLLAGNLLCVIPSEIVKYFPIGLSSMVRIETLGFTSGVSIKVAFFILIVPIGLILVWLLNCGSRKLLN